MNTMTPPSFRISPHSRTNKADSRGFSLVEIMVAMVIGMLGILIMMQVFSVAEGQKRSTTGSGDAQSNGAMAVYSLQRDIRQAGYGFNALNALGCTLAIPAPVTHTLTQLAPVIINPPVADVPAGDANTDTLLVTYARSEGAPEGDAITLISGSQLGVLTAANFNVGDRVVAAPGVPTAACAVSLATVSAVTLPSNITAASSGAVDEGTLFNFGAAPGILAYAIRGGNLTVCDYTLANCGTACTAGDLNCNANWTPIASNIVSLRAQYGRDTTTPSDGVVDVWDQATPPATTGLAVAPTTPEGFACLWARASALRVAVVARNSQVDKDTVTAVAPQWSGSGANAIDLSGRANWQNYRYKVFETIVPLRNLPWMASCS